jgi:hypothetical protein
MLTTKESRLLLAAHTAEPGMPRHRIREIASLTGIDLDALNTAQEQLIAFGYVDDSGIVTAPARKP